MAVTRFVIACGLSPTLEKPDYSKAHLTISRVLPGAIGTERVDSRNANGKGHAFKFAATHCSATTASARMAFFHARRCLILAMISNITGTMISVWKVANVRP